MPAGMDMGCLVIGDILADGFEPFDLKTFLQKHGVRAERFRPEGPDGLHLSLQRAYQRVRRDDALSCIAALGSGCDAALALASQLPVDRLALLSPFRWEGGGPMGRAMRGIRRYARRGAALCACEVCVIPGRNTPPDMPEALGRALCGCRVSILGDMWREGKEDINSTVLRFLLDGVLPKSLAENSEMCIIYG